MTGVKLTKVTALQVDSEIFKTIINQSINLSLSPLDNNHAIRLQDGDTIRILFDLYCDPFCTIPVRLNVRKCARY